MTKRNMHLRNNDNKPFKLRPAGKDYLWGGTRLNDDFGKNIEMNPLAETWECSTHPDGPSIVVGGEFDGMTLKDVLSTHKDYLGTHPRTDGELPILIKFIDAKKNLSVQVHPDDEYARMYEHGALGKTEMWYIIDAKENAEIIYGFKRDVDKKALRYEIEPGDIEKYLQRVNVKKDDVFYIEAGTVHAIGAGTLIAEIQENSNLTYRLYDYNRIDKNGNKRELHIEKAFDVMNIKGSSSPRQPMRVFKHKKGCATEFLGSCKYFHVERQYVNTETCRELVSFRTDSNSFQVLLCMDGCGTIFGDDLMINFFKGDCIFVPANSMNLKLHGCAKLLKVFC